MKESTTSNTYSPRRREFLKGLLFAGIETSVGILSPAISPSGRVGLVVAGVGTATLSSLDLPFARESGILLGVGAMSGSMIRKHTKDH